MLQLSRREEQFESTIADLNSRLKEVGLSCRSLSSILICLVCNLMEVGYCSLYVTNCVGFSFNWSVSGLDFIVCHS